MYKTKPSTSAHLYLKDKKGEKMAVLKIVKFGDETLRKVCRPVDQITPRIKTLVKDMIDTMREAGGVGLAAPQVGILRRIAVIEVDEGIVHVLINPKIIA